MALKTISVIGLGYIGLPTATAIAAQKINVIGVDSNKQIVDLVNDGKIHISEPDLDELVHAVVKDGYLHATQESQSADAYIITVPTPFKEQHKPDLSYIEAASKAISTVLKKGDLIILESTSPVGTTEKMSGWLAEYRTDLTFPHTHGEASDIRVAYCPERVLPGHIVRELIENDRIIGGISHQCSVAAVALYKLFVKGECIITNVRTAEMTKLAENSFRDVNIAFANELSIISDQLNIDVWELIRLSNRHPRVNILQPGAGVGGHCIAVDPWFIIDKSPESSRLIKTARNVNDSKPEWVIEKINLAIVDYLQNNPHKNIKDVTIACFGLTFKPDVNDLRGSPAYMIAKAINNTHSGNVLAVEPNVNSEEYDGIKVVNIDIAL
ncbi:MAG: UDP-N-acetyl-D-mannosamine dehydrogenase, partial [Gammaproteobacteria bacterium]|nr:UDP-N-acetyl-D-mannosamine dehydrogenase [Gammaproteobacteria bacterium]